MSHKATAWLATLCPKSITSGAFRVLFHLCDHHNDERDPEDACFPSQETLMRKTGLSNGGLNKCIQTLESDGILSRRRATKPGTSERRTYYILGCDVDEIATQTPLSGDSPNSTPVETAPEQTPLLSDANSTFEGGKLHPSGEYPKREPVSKNLTPYKSPKSDFDAFWEIVPLKKSKGAARKAYAKALKLTDHDTLMAAMGEYARLRQGHDSQFTVHPATWLNQERWTDEHSPSRSDFHHNLSQALGGPDELRGTNSDRCISDQRIPEALPSPGASGRSDGDGGNPGHGGSRKRAYLRLAGAGGGQG